MSSTYFSQGQAENASTPNRPPSPPSQVFVSRDVHETREYLETSFPGHRFHLSPTADTFSARIASAGDTRLQMHTSTLTAHLEGSASWSKDYVLQWFRSGNIHLHHPYGKQVSTGSRPFMTPNETSFQFAMTPHSRSLVRINAEFFETVAAKRHGQHPQRIVFDLDAIPADAAVKAWQVQVRQTSRILSDTTSPTSTRTAAQIAFVDGILDCFSWTAVDVPAVLRTERTVRLRKAVEYMHAHPHQLITPADVAAAAGLHLRSLQKSMQHHLGVSPNQYFRTIRLDQAHRDLTQAIYPATTIRDVAHRLQFRHLGRFSASYKERFGEQPRETLLR